MESREIRCFPAGNGGEAGERCDGTDQLSLVHDEVVKDDLDWLLRKRIVMGVHKTGRIVRNLYSA